METPKKEGVPIILPVLSVLIFAAMYIFAVYGPVTGPEKTVEKFFTSYENGDNQGMAESLSVFWSAQYLPQYSTAKPSELIAERETIEKDTAASFEKMPPSESDLTVKVLPEYTSEWENSAMVVYAVCKEDETLERGLAHLLKENDQYYIDDWFPLESDETLEQAEDFFVKLDAVYTQLLIDDTWN